MTDFSSSPFSFCLCLFFSSKVEFDVSFIRTTWPFFS